MSHNPFARRRTSSSSSQDYNPFDTAENYYGPKTNPSGFPKNSTLARTRTLSLVEASLLMHLKSILDDSDSNDLDAPLDTNDLNPSIFRKPTDALEEVSERSSETSPDASTADLPVPFRPAGSTSSSLGPHQRQSQNEGPPPPGVNVSGRRPSIVPFYGDLSTDSFMSSDLTAHAQSSSAIPRTIAKHMKQQLEIKKKLNASHYRRASVDDSFFTEPKRFYISDIDLTLKQLLENEDTDHNYQITIEDTGPKVLKLGTANSNGYKQADIRGTYMLSNLLQELTIAKRMGRTQMILDEARLNENPVDRLRRLITTQFWKSLTRQVDENNIAEMARDTKIQEEVFDEKTGQVRKNKVSHRLYIPHDRKDQFDYYTSIRNKCTEFVLDVQYLPEKIDAEYIASINKKPGLLSLASSPDPDHPGKIINQPYVVPGGRFNELYGWDSYMETLGLLVTATSPDNCEHLRLSRGMAENFIFEIHYYGKILNANRSYYLGRSQPPFLTDMAIKIFDKTMEIFKGNESIEKDAKDFLKRATLAAIKEYKTVWTCKPRLDEETGLSCYHPEGKGIPPETEPTHFDTVLEPYAQKYGVSKTEFIEMYNGDKVHEPKLDEYFLHDRAVRESGHDTSYRFEGKCAHLATVDLNSLLYKYETDIAFLLETYFSDELEGDFKGETKKQWLERARVRRQKVTKYLWNDEDGMFYDYNVVSKEITGYESATTFWPLWSKLATKEQAARLVKDAVHKFEEFGGLVSGTKKSRGSVGLDRPSRQWDYPFGWAPQQILAWIGFKNYGYDGITRRLSYRWLYLMTQAFVDFNGIVVEKYDVTQKIAPHKVDAEYGNQGADFKGVATEGFGWVNASYVFGLTFATMHAKRNLGTLTSPDVFLRKLSATQEKLYNNELSEKA
jgi:alpha,alpha-trehalase